MDLAPDNDKTIEFSKKVIETLKNKVKEHNAFSKKKLNLSQIKSIYRKYGFCHLNSDKSAGQWAMAAVNSFIKVAAGEPAKNKYRKSSVSNVAKNDYTIEVSIEPDEEDFQQADLDIKNYKLDDLNFSNAEELYLDDNKSDSIFEI